MSSISVRSVLLNGRPHPKPGTYPAAPFYTPVIRGQNARETVYTILIQSIEGAPTAATLGFRFQAGLSTTGGATHTPPAGVGVYPNGQQWYWTDLRPQWTVLNEVEHAALLPDGDFRQRSASHTMTAPILLVKRIVGGFDHRLRISPFFEGGTNPHFPLSMSVEVRY